MVMIYTDEDETPPSFVSTSIKMTEMLSDSGLQEKIALLQKSLEEKEKLIAELRSENDIFKVSVTVHTCWHRNHKWHARRRTAGYSELFLIICLQIIRGAPKLQPYNIIS